jgi:hypothetical protein
MLEKVVSPVLFFSPALPPRCVDDVLPGPSIFIPSLYAVLAIETNRQYLPDRGGENAEPRVKDAGAAKNTIKLAASRKNII